MYPDTVPDMVSVFHVALCRKCSVHGSASKHVCRGTPRFIVGPHRMQFALVAVVGKGVGAATLQDVYML